MKYTNYYNDYYSQISKSKAHAVFCEKVYGRNFCQEGMLTQLQLEKLIEIVKDGPCKNILELGCGNGMLAEYIFDKTGAHIVGVDFSEEAINQAMKRTFGKKEKIRFIQCNIEDINLIDGNFDMILAVDALYDHFVDNIPEVLKKLRNLLADDGKLVVFQSFIAEKEEDAGSLDAENTYIGKALTENGFHYSVTDFTQDDKDHWKLKIQTAKEMESIFAEEGNIELYNFQINKAEKLLSYLEDKRGKRYFLNMNRKKIFQIYHKEEE
ncbi:MAG TPA: class I SAM-dependent methyltransferase [bacterium]|jgi:cyclopropane fatty-acyl-phospholipid synthase-like methyltransferase|nr:class I SAM-dependent methyltransferase [bacterium]HQN72237.1 class I SAM-dependent methyltransferase [bacterium]